MSLPDVVGPDEAIGLFRARLLSVAEVTAIVGGRIVGANADAPDFGTITKPALALEVAPGGRTDYTGAVGRLTIRVGALSMESAGAARELYRVARAALQAEGLSSTADEVKGLTHEVAMGHDGWFESAKCWATVGLWRLTVVRDRS